MFRTALLGFAVVLAAGCHVVEGNGVRGIDERTVPGFERVHVEDGLEVEVVVGERTENKVVVSGDENIVTYVETEVRDGELRLSMPVGSFSTRSPLKVTVEAAYLNRLEADDGARVEASGLNAQTLALAANGGAQVTAEGACDRLDLGADHGARALLRGLSARSAFVSVEGGSHAEVLVLEEIEIVATGGSTLYVAGNPPRNLRQKQADGAQVIFE